MTLLCAGHITIRNGRRTEMALKGSVPRRAGVAGLKAGSRDDGAALLASRQNTTGYRIDRIRGRIDNRGNTIHA